MNIAVSKTGENTSVNAVVKQSTSKRLALVVGVDDYPEAPLRFPVKDAELMTKQLESVGFEVMLIKNPTLGALEEARDEFIKKVNQSGEDVTALFFFAGHAIQFDGHNYIIPAKSKLFSNSNGLINNAPNKAAFIDRGFDAQLSVLNYLGESKASKIIFVLDACRTNPFNPDHRAGSRPHGLVKMNAKSGGPETFIFFAADPGRVAFDGDNTASNSPFTQAFTNAISQPGSTLEAVYRQVYDRVQSSTNGQQRPYQEGVLFSFMFRDAQKSLELDLKQSRINTGFEKRDYDMANDGVALLKKILEKKSFKELLQAAENGDAEAQYLVAAAYSSGEGVSTNQERTSYWLRRSAVRGFGRAQFFYGSLLFYGEGAIKRNPEEGLAWWQVASENGNLSALINMGDAYRIGTQVKEDLEKAEQYYQRVLSAGHKEAETNLGRLYDARAIKAKKINDKKAFETAQEKKLAYYKQAAAKGSSDGMKLLAYMYHYGDHVMADLPMAIQWYKKAVDAGDVDAAERLTSLYTYESETTGRKSQPKEAEKYLRIAILLGSKTAGVDLAELIRDGKVAAKTPDEALQLYEQALVNGSLVAAAKLSDIYLKGDLVKKDPNKAEQYALTALELSKTVKPDSEDALPTHKYLAAFNLLKLYREEGVKPATTGLVDKLAAQVGTFSSKMKRFTVPIICGSVASSFNVYVWDWSLDEPSTTEQFNWLKNARGCEVSKDVVESFQKLYKIARENKVSFHDLCAYALGNANKDSKTPKESK